MEEVNALEVVDPETYKGSLLRGGVHSDGRPVDKAQAFSVQVGNVESASGSCMLRQGNMCVMGVVHAQLATPHHNEKDKGIVTVSMQLSNSACASDVHREWVSDWQTQIDELLQQDLIVDRKTLLLKHAQLCWKLSCSIVILNTCACLLDSCLTCVEVALRSVKLPQVTFEEDFVDEEGNSVGRKIKPIIDYDKKHALTVVDHVPVASTFLITDFLQVVDGKSEPELLNEPSWDELLHLKGAFVTIVTRGNPPELVAIRCVPFRRVVALTPGLIDKCYSLAAHRHLHVSKVIQAAFK